MVLGRWVHLNNHRYAREFMQVDGGDNVLWPQGRTVKGMYDTEFRAWLCGQQDLGPDDIPNPYPSLSTFRRVKRDGQFKYIKSRSEHNHTRCAKCKSLQVLLCVSRVLSVRSFVT